MASFEEVARAAQRDNEFEMIYNALYQLIQVSDHYRLCQRILPFLPHVNDGGNLNMLHAYLQSSQQSPIARNALVHNVVNTAKTNPNLKRTLEILIGR